MLGNGREHADALGCWNRCPVIAQWINVSFAAAPGDVRPGLGDRGEGGHGILWSSADGEVGQRPAKSVRTLRMTGYKGYWSSYLLLGSMLVLVLALWTDVLDLTELLEMFGVEMAWENEQTPSLFLWTICYRLCNIELRRNSVACRDVAASPLRGCLLVS